MARTGLAVRTLAAALLCAVVLNGPARVGHPERRGGVLEAAAVEPRPGAAGCRDGQPSSSTAPSAVRRMAKAEFGRTVWDLIGADVADALPALSGLIAGIPDDDVQAGFANITWSLSAAHVSAYLGVANEIGVQVSLDDSHRRKFLPCAKDAKDIKASCIKSFLDTFAVRAYRRPLEPAEKDELLRFFQAQHSRQPATALSSLIARVLMSPSFLFKQGPGPSRDDRCAPSPVDESFARASQLSYGIWGTMPDAELFAAAGRGDLVNDAKLSLHIERMLGDKKARDWFRTFFRQWLHYEYFIVESYSWGFLANLDRAHLHDNATEELDRFIEEIVWNDKGTFSDLMTSRKVFTRAKTIRLIYGLPDEPAGGVEHVPGNRSGILTRVAMLAQGFDDASLVKRGALIRRQILCDPLSPPDPSLLPAGSLVPPEKDYKLTTRQRWEARTAPAICQGCHRSFNPFGFSLEAYDGVGRARTIEKQPIPSSSPQGYTELTIDTSVVANVENRSEPAVDGPVALSELIGKSKKANLCFVKQVSKFVSGAVGDAELPPLQDLAEEMMRPSGSIHDVLAGVAKLKLTKKRGADATN
jgi:hypothetical protein